MPRRQTAFLWYSRIGKPNPIAASRLHGRWESCRAESLYSHKAEKPIYVVFCRTPRFHLGPPDRPTVAERSRIRHECQTGCRSSCPPGRAYGAEAMGHGYEGGWNVSFRPAVFRHVSGDDQSRRVLSELHRGSARIK